MTYKTDGGGLALKCNDIKLCTGGSWATKLCGLNQGKQKGIVRIMTFSLPHMGYVKEQFERRPYDIFLIAHSKFLGRAQRIKSTFPDIRVAVHDEMHSKLLLIEPQTVYISSANFGNSGWHESSIGLHSQEAHEWYKREF